MSKGSERGGQEREKCQVSFCGKCEEKESTALNRLYKWKEICKSKLMQSKNILKTLHFIR